MFANNDQLAQIIAAAEVASVDDVIAVLQKLDGQLSNDDGLKWFNLLYLKVTEGVRDQSAAFHWENIGWLQRLDDIFAKLYFAAISGWMGNREEVARAWLPLNSMSVRPMPGLTSPAARHLWVFYAHESAGLAQRPAQPFEKDSQLLTNPYA